MKIRSPELTHLTPGNLHPLTVMSPLSPSPSPWQPPRYPVSVLAYFRFHTEVRFLQYLYFSYFISHNAFRPFHVVRRGRISFFSVDKQYSILCVYLYIFIYIACSVSIYLSISRHFGCFHVLAFVNNITINRRVQMCLQDSDFISFGCIPTHGIAGLYVVLFLTFWGTSILFSIVTIFIYIPTNSVLEFPFFPRSHQHSLSLVFFMIAILTGMKWHLIVVLICIPLIIYGVELLSLYLLVICVSS